VRWGSSNFEELQVAQCGSIIISIGPIDINKHTYITTSGENEITVHNDSCNDFFIEKKIKFDSI